MVWREHWGAESWLATGGSSCSCRSGNSSLIVGLSGVGDGRASPEGSPAEFGTTAPRVLLALSLILCACTTANTPQQNLAYERWAKCRSPFVQLERVDLDGRVTFRFSDASGRQEVFACFAEAGRVGPPLPEPRAVGLPGGP